MNDEEALVRQAQADPTQFVLLYDKYVRQIYAYVWREVGERPLTEDIVAATFEKALAALPRYRWRGVPFGAWLYKIARNEIRKQHNRQKRLTPLDETAPSELVVEQVAQQADQHSQIRAMLATLSERDQEMIRLHFDEALTHQEISVMLGCSTRNVAVRLHRALTRLRQAVNSNRESAYATKK